MASGDIMESWPNHQGFDYVAFPIHQQGQLTVFNDDAAADGIAVGIGKNQYDDRFTLDHWFRPDPSHMATVAGGKRGEKVRVKLNVPGPGENPIAAKFSHQIDGIRRGNAPSM